MPAFIRYGLCPCIGADPVICNPVVDIRHVALYRKILQCLIKVQFFPELQFSTKTVGLICIEQIISVAIAGCRVKVCFQWIFKIFVKHTESKQLTSSGIHFIAHIKIANLVLTRPVLPATVALRSKS